MTRRKWAIAACAVGVAGIAGALVYYDQVSRPGTPVLTVLGEPKAVTWEPIPTDEFEQLPWSSGKRSDFGVGRGEWQVAYHGPAGRKEHVIPGPLRDEARYFRQELLTLEVPDRLWGRRRVSITLIASGQVSPDAKEFYLSFYDARGIDARHRLTYDESVVDQQTGVMTVRIAWAFPRGEARMCNLRFRLTPEGFVFVGQ